MCKAPGESEDLKKKNVCWEEGGARGKLALTETKVLPVIERKHIPRASDLTYG